MAVKATQLAWLAGLFDGEGYIYVLRMGRGSLVAGAVLSMVDPRTHDVVCALLSQLGVAYGDCSARRKDKQRHRPVWRIEVRSQEGLAKLASCVSAYAVTKAEHWTIVRDYVESRMASRGSRRGYSEAEYGLAAKSQTLNRRGPRANIVS